MRHIYNLPESKLPRDAEFKFKERAKTLVEKWHDILNASKSNGEGTVRKPAANGKAHSEEASPTSTTFNVECKPGTTSWHFTLLKLLLLSNAPCASFFLHAACMGP